MSRRAGQARRPQGAGRPANVGGRKGALGPVRGERAALPWAWSCPFGNDCGYFHPRTGSWIRLTCERWCGQPHRPRHYGTPVSITEDAPVQAPPQPRPRRRAAAAWWWLVAVCVLLLVAVAATLTIWWAASRETRTTSYRVLGDLAGIRLDLGDADVEIDGGATAVEVRRVDRFAYGAPVGGAPLDRRRRRSRIVSRCPDQVLGSCRTVYRLTVPDNVPLEIETSSGSVRLSGVRATVQVSTGSGAISATGFCGFPLRASSDSGDVQRARRVLGRPARAALAQRRRARGRPVRALPDRRPERLGLDAASAASRRSDDAPFQIQALSTSGDVTVEAAS